MSTLTYTAAQTDWTREQALSYLRQAVRDCGTVELRVLRQHGNLTGLFNDPVEILRQAAAAEGNAYITINAPQLLRPDNRLRAGDDPRAHALRDQHIVRYTRIAIDVDPVRPKGTNSSNAELAAAQAVRNAVVSYLGSLGWPTPTIACSGNGFHAVYRCILDVTPENRILIRSLLHALHAHFSTPEAKVDRTLHNPSRILRLYGTLNRKGDATDERPNRLATCHVPRRWACVIPSRIRSAVARLSPEIAARTPHATAHGAIATPPATPLRVFGERASGGDYASLDIVAYMRAAGLYKRPLGGGRHAVRCAWVQEHSDEDWFERTDTVVWEASNGGWPQFFCSHDHCADRRIVDLIRHLGGADQFCTRARA